MTTLDCVQNDQYSVANIKNAAKNKYALDAASKKKD
jgi:hypothetical protein